MKKILAEKKDINLNIIQKQNINININLKRSKTSLDYYFLYKKFNTKNPPIKTKKRKKLNINTSSYKSITQKYTNNKEIVLKAKEIMAYNDEEINNLSYKLALKFDYLFGIYSLPEIFRIPPLSD